MIIRDTKRLCFVDGEALSGTTLQCVTVCTLKYKLAYCQNWTKVSDAGVIVSKLSNYRFLYMKKQLDGFEADYKEMGHLINQIFTHSHLT